MGYTQLVTEGIYRTSMSKYLLREEGRRRIRIEVPREEAVDQLGLQAGSKYKSVTYLLGL